jgi:uncharacterized protein YggU (UPF0235/DUF167 family)
MATWPGTPHHGAGHVVEDMAAFWRSDANGIVVAVRAQPRARREGVQDVVNDAAGRPRLRIAVTAPPEDGRATKAVCAVLASALAVPVSRVTVLSGAAAREKLLHVAGSAEALAAAMRALGGAGAPTAPEQGAPHRKRII